MGDGVDLKQVVKHIVDGTLEESLCRICLLPLGDVCENVHTKVVKDNQEFCAAKALEEICKIQFSDNDNYNVCTECFLMATTAYKFHLLSQRSTEILNFYIEELEKNVYSLETYVDGSNDTLCIALPDYTPNVPNLDCGILFSLTDEYHADFDNYSEESKEDIKKETAEERLNQSENEKLKKDEDLILVIKDNGVLSYYKLGDDAVSKEAELSPKPKARRNRKAMVYRGCSQCPIKYRFFARLKLHMKDEHDIDVFLCKVCNEIVEGRTEYDRHTGMHTNVHHCNICNAVFKKRETIIAHLKWHEEMKNLSKKAGAHVCEMCGFILQSEDALQNHYDQKHEKKYTCHYCGKMYKGEKSCQNHVQKHEMYMDKKMPKKGEKEPIKDEKQKANKKKDSNDKASPICSTCGKSFVDERALMWHLRLHTNERPYTCDVCGRGFITVNRRNQHVLCAHTMPTKRCPLCPALFHLRSMVSSHIKKVHLKAHKRRNRSSKHRSVHWRTETVPIQELSLGVQNEILELKTNDEWGLRSSPEENI